MAVLLLVLELIVIAADAVLLWLGWTLLKSLRLLSTAHQRGAVLPVARSDGPRFWIEAVDANGRVLTGVDHRSDDQQGVDERWTRLQQSSDVGYFTLWDSHHPGHRGRFSRGV